MFRALCLYVLLSLSSVSHAHNVVAGAYVDGMTIEGEVGLSNGEMAQVGVVVEVFDAAGKKLGETQIGEEGLFTYEAPSVQDYRIKANLGAGHVAEIQIVASDFSGGAPKQSVIKAKSMSMEKTLALSEADLERIVRKAVSQQVKPLQKELRAYKEKVFFRDVLGGLGFIFGMVGVAMYLAARRKEKDDASVS